MDIKLIQFSGRKYTNLLNLPQPIVLAVLNDPYERGDVDYRVTELLKPPRARVLTRKHRNEIVEDISERIWALCGQIGHAILERAGEISNRIVERNFIAKVGPYRVGGRADLVLHAENDRIAHLKDYKFTSKWTSKDGVKPDWEAQCNMLVYLAAHDEERPMGILSAQIIAIYRDWSKAEESRKPERERIPQVQAFDVRMWEHAATERFILDRIDRHEHAEQELPLCTAEERWASKDQWAVKKPANKRAHRVLDNENQANIMAAQEGMIVEFRKGESRRCPNYCLAFPFCDQAKKEFGIK